jgi:hypothetical protein
MTSITRIGIRKVQEVDTIPRTTTVGVEDTYTTSASSRASRATKAPRLHASGRRIPRQGSLRLPLS